MNNKATLFIDESGKSSLLEKAEEPFILTGVILNDIEVIKIEGYFNYIKRKYKIPENKPFHSFHVFENPSTKLSDSILTNLSKTLSDFIELIPCQILIYQIDKKVMKVALGVKSEDDFKGSSERKEISEAPHIISSAGLFGDFSKYLKINNKLGQIITDARRGGDAQLLKTLYRCKEGSIPFNEGLAEYIKEHLHAICFAEKGFLSGGLEITDLISFVTFFHVRRMISSTESQGIPNIWNSIKQRAEIKKLSEDDIRRFFKVKNGVYKAFSK